MANLQRCAVLFCFCFCVRGTRSTTRGSLAGCAVSQARGRTHDDVRGAHDDVFVSGAVFDFAAHVQPGERRQNRRRVRARARPARGGSRAGVQPSRLPWVGAVRGRVKGAGLRDGDGDGRAAGPDGERRGGSLEPVSALADAVHARGGDRHQAALVVRGHQARDRTYASVGPRHRQGQRPSLGAGVQVEDGDSRRSRVVPAHAGDVHLHAAVRDRDRARGVRQARGQDRHAVHGAPVAVATVQNVHHPHRRRGHRGDIRISPVASGGNDVARAPRRDGAILVSDHAHVAGERERRGTRRARAARGAKLPQQGQAGRHARACLPRRRCCIETVVHMTGRFFSRCAESSLTE